MTRLVQVDIACKDPQALAQWHAQVLGIEAQEVFEGIFSVTLESSELHFVTSQAAGVEGEPEGVHQLQFSVDKNMDDLKAHCQSLSVEFQEGNFAGKASLFVADAEENPVILFASA